MFSPSVFRPSVFSPSVFSPSVFSPSVFSPSVFSPSVFTPSVFSPSVFAGLPVGLLAVGVQPVRAAAAERCDAYESAQLRSLIAVSANDGTAAEHVVADTWNNTGSFYVRVNGRNGTFAPARRSTCDRQDLRGTCGGVAPSDGRRCSPRPRADVVAAQTLMLTDYARITDDGTLATMKTKLATFAARAEVAGDVVDLGAEQPACRRARRPGRLRTPTARTRRTSSPSAIRDIVTSYRAQNPG